MQNKPNFRKADMNLTLYGNKDYENETAKNVPGKQTQNKPNLLPPNMDATSVPTKDYENETAFSLRAKQTQFIAA